MQRELDLTQDQRERTDKILKESQERTREIMKPVAADLRTEVQKTMQQFREVLTPQQRTNLENLLRRPHSHDPRSQSAPHGKPPPGLHPTNAAAAE
jgi:hypothetical protein